MWILERLGLRRRCTIWSRSWRRFWRATLRRWRVRRRLGVLSRISNELWAALNLVVRGVERDGGIDSFRAVCGMRQRFLFVGPGHLSPEHRANSLAELRGVSSSGGIGAVCSADLR